MYSFCRGKKKGTQSSEISIPEQLFTDGLAEFDNLIDYRVQVTITNAKGVSGSAFLRVQLNLPPHGGSCFVDPKTGDAMSTPFTMTCTNWVDSDGVKQTQFFGTEMRERETVDVPDLGPRSRLTYSGRSETRSARRAQVAKCFFLSKRNYRMKSFQSLLKSPVRS